MNLIINPQFESLCPPLNEERDAACDEAQEARAEADRDAKLHGDRARLQARMPAGRRTGTGAAVLVAALGKWSTVAACRPDPSFSSSSFLAGRIAWMPPALSGPP